MDILLNFVKKNRLTIMVITGMILTIPALCDENDSLISNTDYASYSVFDEEYYVKPGDTFFVGITGHENKDVVSRVNMSGNLVLHPLSSPVKVAGKKLKDARSTIIKRLSEDFFDVRINVELMGISPQKINIMGAVNNPGEIVVDSLSTLNQSIKKAGGFASSASRKVTLFRRGEPQRINLNNYLYHGKIADNPYLFNGDIVFVDFAESYAKLYVVTDSVNYSEYFEIKEDSMPLRALLKRISSKYMHSDYENISLYRDDQLISMVDKDYLVADGDTIYLKPEESYVFVRGNVNNPGKVNFIPGKLPYYYISVAGGVTQTGTDSRIRIIRGDGESFRYRGEELKHGDTVVVPLSTRAFIMDYLNPVSTVLSMITTIIVLTN